MNYDRTIIKDIILKIIFRQQLSAEETIQYEEWIVIPANKQLFDELTDRQFLEKLFNMPEEEQKKSLEYLLGQLARREAMETGEVKLKPTRQTTSDARFGRKIGIAAALSGLLVFGAVFAYLWRTGRPQQVQAIVSKPEQVLPGSAAAMLVLDDGSHVTLDSASASFTRQQGAATIKGSTGELAYQPRQSDAKASLSFNTLVVPNSGEYALVLADGTRIMVNSATTVKYPTTFADTARVVELSGEAYFEVAKSQKPFYVKIDRDGLEPVVVKVLGTHFNISAYKEQDRIEATLLEGKVDVSHGTASALLLPGQQAVSIRGQQGIKLNKNVDTASIVAWKNGLFAFSGVSLHPMMDQIARWYNIKISIRPGTKERKFYGFVSRKTTLESVLTYLKNNGVDYQLNGRELEIFN